MQADLIRWHSQLRENVERDDSAQFRMIRHGTSLVAPVSILCGIGQRVARMTIRWECKRQGIDVDNGCAHAREWRVAQERHAMVAECPKK